MNSPPLSLSIPRQEKGVLARMARMAMKTFSWLFPQTASPSHQPEAISTVLRVLTSGQFGGSPPQPRRRSARPGLSPGSRAVRVPSDPA